MYHLGVFYYPEGLCKGTSEPFYQIAYLDKEGNRFWICYTKIQFEEHLKINGGIFRPFIPLYHLTEIP